VSAACLSDPVLSARAQKISRRAYWLSDPDLRQHSHAGLNKGEASNSVRRAVFFHRQGEICDRTFENQSFRASGLSLITAAIVVKHLHPRSQSRKGSSTRDNEQMIERARKRLRKRAKRGLYPVATVASMAQTIPEPPSSPSASCRQRMPTLPTFDAGSPKEPISAMMPA